MTEADKNTLAKTKKKFYKQPVFWVITVFLFIIIGATGSGDQTKKTETSNNTASQTTTTPEATEQKESTTEPANTEPVVTEPDEPTVTVSQSNAVDKAKSYLDFAGFSRDGLVAQLEFDKFSNADAIYGADNAGADWNEQAAKKAKSYMDFSSFSRQGLIDQLEFDKFTTAQATYGADSVGL